jgi:TrmH family RNA methyltransferase
MKSITSADNQFIKLARRLHAKKHRDASGLLLVEGKRSVEEALQRPDLIHVLFCEDTMPDAGAYDIAGISCFAVSSKLSKHICATESPQGVAAIVKKPSWSWEETVQKGGLLVLLDRVADPGNMGSIIRTCWALGVDGLLATSGSADPFAPKVVRASMGGILNLPIYTNIGAPELKILQDERYQFICTDLDRADNYYDVSYSGRRLIVLGSEADGVAHEIKAFCEHSIKIPMKPKVDSLNVAAACAIIIAEAWRQRNGGSVMSWDSEYSGGSCEFRCE